MSRLVGKEKERKKRRKEGGHLSISLPPSSPFTQLSGRPLRFGYVFKYAPRFVCRGLDFKVPSRSILNTPTNLSLSIIH